MPIFRHPDGSYHRHPPHAAEAKLEPIKDRPNWYRNTRTGVETYVEPPPPPPDIPIGVCLSPAVLRAAAAINSWYRNTASRNQPERLPDETIR